MTTRYYLKVLHLVPAAVANQYGIPAEAPTFLSRYVPRAKPCAYPSCGVTFQPLTYQTGYTTTAHHYHGTGEGGIYFYISQDPQLPCRSPLNAAGWWVAQVEPLGEWATKSTVVGQAPAVRCLGITAWCMPYLSEMSDPPGHAHDVHPITTGQLLLLPDRMSSHEHFEPVCDQHTFALWLAPLRFQILDGTVYFQRRS
jgi:hypothetical protein